jgi:outer membrane lipoprotein-sorting protein
MDTELILVWDKYSMKKVMATLFILCFALSAPFIICAEEEPATRMPAKGKAAVLARIEKTVSTVKTVTSEFHQERRLAMLKEPALSNGRFYYEKPDRLRWEFIDPAPSGFLVNGKLAKQWKGKDNPSEAFDMQQNPVIRLIVDQIVAWTKADFTWIEQRYSITIVKENPIVMKLVPRSSKEKKYIDHLLISFDADTEYVNTVGIIEKGGDSTTIRFVHMVVNSTLHKNLFE